MTSNAESAAWRTAAFDIPARPAFVVASRTARRTARSGVLWGYVFGLYIASSALGYAATYKTMAQRAQFARVFGANAGVNALIGPAHSLQTVPGFTEWRCTGVLSVVGAVWGLLAATRLTRGEEEAGRWEHYLAGGTTRGRSAAQALVGLGAGWVVLWAIPALVTVVAGRSSRVRIDAGHAVFLALGVTASAAAFLAIGALTGQLATTRRQAASYAGATLGIAYALRMVADSGTGLAWLRWATPLGWAEELRPITAPRPVALLPFCGLVVVASVASVTLAARRDLGAGVLGDRGAHRARTRLLGGPSGLAIRLSRPVALAWAIAIALGALLMGLIAKSAGSVLSSSTSASRVFSRLGARGVGADAYLGVAFLIVAVLLTFVAAGHVTAARADEAEGRLDNLLVRPVARASWYGGRLLIGATVVAALGVAAGAFAWIGAASHHAGVRPGDALGAGVNAVPPALLVLGLGFLALGAWPRAAAAVTYGVLAWSFLVDVLGGIVNANHWLLDTSVFHQMAAAPAVSPDWTSAAALTGIGLAGALVGAATFHRRDMVGT